MANMDYKLTVVYLALSAIGYLPLEKYERVGYLPLEKYEGIGYLPLEYIRVYCLFVLPLFCFRCFTRSIWKKNDSTLKLLINVWIESNYVPDSQFSCFLYKMSRIIEYCLFSVLHVFIIANLKNWPKCEIYNCNFRKWCIQIYLRKPIMSYFFAIIITSQKFLNLQ